MISGPVPDWIAEVMRAWIPFPSIVHVELDAEGFLALLGDLTSEQLIGDRHEIDEFEPVDRSGLGVGGRSAGGEDRGDAAGPGGDRTPAGEL